MNDKVNVGKTLLEKETIAKSLIMQTENRLIQGVPFFKEDREEDDGFSVNESDGENSDGEVKRRRKRQRREVDLDGYQVLDTSEEETAIVRSTNPARVPKGAVPLPTRHSNIGAVYTASEDDSSTSGPRSGRPPIASSTPTGTGGITVLGAAGPSTASSEAASSAMTSPAKKGPAKKDPANKSPAKKVATKKIPAKKVATKKSPAKKVQVQQNTEQTTPIKDMTGKELQMHLARNQSPASFERSRIAGNASPIQTSRTPISPLTAQRVAEEKANQAKASKAAKLRATASSSNKVTIL